MVARRHSLGKCSQMQKNRDRDLETHKPSIVIKSSRILLYFDLCGIFIYFLYPTSTIDLKWLKRQMEGFYQGWSFRIIFQCGFNTIQISKKTAIH